MVPYQARFDTHERPGRLQKTPSTDDFAGVAVSIELAITRVLCSAHTAIDELGCSGA